jgi:glycine/D-amino acid oxidase-like deaminating enzyme
LATPALDNYYLATAGVRPERPPLAGTQDAHMAREGTVTVRTAGGAVRARHAVIAAGGYLAGLVPALERAILPIATYVMATEPLGEAAAQLVAAHAAIYDTRFAFDYYRRVDSTRLLWADASRCATARPKTSRAS